MTSPPTDRVLSPADLPLVSVIIPIYNGEEDIPDLVACLRSQTYPPERVEYLLVDNNSRDRTAELLQSAAQECAASGMVIQPLTEATIQSSYAARNTGIRAAQGTIFAFTDADCRPHPQWLEGLVAPFADSGVGLVVGEVLALEGSTLLERHADRQGVLSQKNTLAHSFCPYGQTANLALRSVVFQQVGLFRPYLTTGGDADFCWRLLRETAWTYVFAETASVQHRHRATLREYEKQWYRYGKSNKYLHELHGVALQPPLTPQKTLYLLSRWLLKQLPSTSLNILKGQASAVDLLDTPINVFGAWARDRGQREAQLPEQAKVIEWLN